MGAVLGPGVLALPSSAAAAAGPASVLAWAGLIALSLPVALVFAALGARHPDGGGVSAFVRRAFGERAAAPVGWWFYWAVPLGVPAAALIGGAYVAAAAGLGGATATGGGARPGGRGRGEHGRPAGVGARAAPHGGAARIWRAGRGWARRSPGPGRSPCRRTSASGEAWPFSPPARRSC
ncbi:amino acid permease [Streptomyces sp. NPDC005046]